MADENASRKVGDTWVLERLMTIPELHEADPGRDSMARYANFESFVGTAGSGMHLTVAEGRIAEALPGPILMKSWAFAFRATPEAWAEHWRDIPKAGFHDILALTRHGLGSVEGDMHAFLANLQFFKDLLALPRGYRKGIVA